MKIHKSVVSFANYVGFFLLIASVSTCSLMLYASLSMNHADMSRMEEAAIIITNIFFMSFLVTFFYGIVRKIRLQIPVNRIVEGVSKISNGKFSERIAPMNTNGKRNEFDVIIDYINKMAGELSDTETLRTDFVANVSHEIKTPLAVIQNYTTMLQESKLSEEEQKEYLETIADAVRHLSNLVTNMLRLNKLENQSIYPEQKEYNLSEQLRMCLLGFEEKWEEKNLELEVDLQDVWIKCDEELLEIVWNNLISNAVKFTPDGGKIRISLKEQQEEAIVKVTDTGCGMDENTGRHIFDKFYQGDTSHKKEGNGLGLAMVKRVISIVRGDISIQSVLGKGTTFIVTIGKGMS